MGAPPCQACCTIKRYHGPSTLIHWRAYMGLRTQGEHALGSLTATECIMLFSGQQLSSRPTWQTIFHISTMCLHGFVSRSGCCAQASSRLPLLTTYAGEQFPFYYGMNHEGGSPILQCRTSGPPRRSAELTQHLHRLAFICDIVGTAASMSAMTCGQYADLLV